MAKIPSPCIGVCKFKRGDHCIGCSMNKDQKKIFKSLKKARMKQAFIKDPSLTIEEVVAKQTSLEITRFRYWAVGG